MTRRRKTEIEPIAFSKVLKTVMRERGLTLKQISDMAGVAASVVGDWSAGTNPQDLKAVGRLSRSLGMSMRSLLLGEPEEIKTVSSISELFDEQDFFNDICRISIKRLTLKK